MKRGVITQAAKIHAYTQTRQGTQQKKVTPLQVHTQRGTGKEREGEFSEQRCPRTTKRKVEDAHGRGEEKKKTGASARPASVST